MNYSIEIDHKNQFKKYTHSGIITADDIGFVWENELLARKEFTELKYNLLTDYREAKFDIPISLFQEIVDFMQAIKSIIKGKKQSNIVDDPYSTAATVIFENRVITQVGFLVKVFNTEEAALLWLAE